MKGSSAKGSSNNVDEGSASMKKRSSFESVGSGDKAGTSIKKTRRKKRRSSTGSVESNSFANRLDTSLLASVEFSINENEEFDIIDVEQEMELNRKKEKVRKEMKKKKNKKDAIDPRLYPSYHDRAENKSAEFDDDDELSMPNFGQSSMASNSMRSTRSSFHSIRSRTSLQKVSAVQGRKVVQLSVVVSPPDYEDGKKRKGIDFSKALKDSQKEGVVRGIRPKFDLSTFSSPVRLLEIENQEAILVKGIVDIDSKAKTSMKVASVKQSKAPKPKDTPVRSLRQRTFGGDIRDFDVVKSERGKRARKDKLRQHLVWSMDDINSLKLSRKIQGWIPFLPGYESYLVGQVVEVLSDSVVSDPNISNKVKRQLKTVGKNELNDVLGFAFKNDNVSKIIIQCVDDGWDFSRHLFQLLSRSRWYDTLGQLPTPRSIGFPRTENYPAPCGLLSKIQRKDVEENDAFDLSKGQLSFEERKRNQYGTYIGRYKTNEFRIDNRLPVDESIVHSFIVSPLSTMVDNGAVHVLRVMAKHWTNTLAQPFGNLTHHRLELLDPFETMRVHMPIVCLVLSSLRGRNVWDAQVLGPFVHKCQTLAPSSTANECLGLVNEMLAIIVPNLSACVAAIEKPLVQWLEAIEESCLTVEAEANEIFKLVTGVEIGLQFGYDLMTQVSWKVPKDKELEKALALELNGEYPGEIITDRNIRRALNSATPRDKKSLYDLFKADLEDSKPAKVLMERMKNLLKREIRRELLNDAIRELSVGELVYESDLKIGDYYWLDDENDKKSVYMFEEEESDDIVAYRFVHADTEEDRVIRFGDLEAMQCRRYIPVAESIVRAQRCYMNIELDRCNKFKLNTFTEFSFLRTALNRLVVVSQLFCEELDIARLRLLKKVKTINQAKVGPGDLKSGRTYYIYNSEYNVYAPFLCKKKYAPSDPEWQKLEKIEMLKSLPQSTIVIGNGITGLMTTIHSVESVITSGGDIKLYKPSGDKTKEGEVFERAQIMRLDPRWASMLRYHLGTIFEDTFIPTSSESHAHLGSNLPTQGFLEITLKDLECILHAEVTKLWSKKIIEVCMGENVSYDAELNSLVKLGEHLEVDDKVFRRVDPMGNPCKELHRWTVAETQNAETVEIGDLNIGKEYDIFVRKEKAVMPFKLIEVDLYTRTYKFESLKKDIKNIAAAPHDLPPIHPKGSKRLYKTVTIRCETKGESGSFHCDTISETLNGQRFMVDIGHNHVVDCTRKPAGSPHHFEVTSSEPCGYCCISRLDRRMGSQGVGDLISSGKLPRIIGDSIKLVRQSFIAKEMIRLMKTDNWREHFEKIIENSDFSSLNDKDPVGTKLVEAVEWYNLHTDDFRRQTLRVKLSETADNFFLAMELPREYQKWKDETVDRLLLSIKDVSKTRRRLLEELKETLKHGMDILWFEACLEVLRVSSVYDLDAKNRIPAAPLINSYTKEALKYLSVGESFRVASKPTRKFDIVLKQRDSPLSLISTTFARSADGTVQRFSESIEVFREGCLSRVTDGDGESKSAVVTTSVSHYVNNHSISANEQNKGYVFASIGDEESTSHFMDQSALTGGCINAVQFNRFLRSAMEGIPMADRLQLYSKEINWTNGEIVQRSTMGSFGEDGLLRPGFSNKQVLRYVWWQIVGGKQNIESNLERDWLSKFSASMVPRGMQLNSKFTKLLKDDTNLLIFDMLVETAKSDYSINWSESLEESLKARKDEISKLREGSDHKEMYWEQFFEGWKPSFDAASHERLQGYFGEIAAEAEQFVIEVINFARESHLYDRTKGQELWNQPKPVDSITGDFAADGRLLPIYMYQLTAVVAACVAAVVCAAKFDDNKSIERTFEICSILVSLLSLILSALIMINSWKYKTRNREARAIYLNHSLMSLKKAAFAAMDTKERGEESDDDNPFLEDLEEKKKKFVEDVIYYGLEDPDDFIYDYKRLMERNDEAASFKHFQKLLITYYIPDVYQSNSYVQESLVEVYKVCDEIHGLLIREEKKTDVKERDHVTNLFHRARDLGPLLEKSISSRLFNADIFVAFRYLASLLCISSIKKEIPVIPIETETYGIIKSARKVRDEHFGLILKREIHDLEYLHRAIVESDKGTVVFLSALLVFVSSVIFAISRFVVIFFNENTVLAVVALWALLSVAILGLLSFCYLVSYFCHLLWLWVKVGIKLSARRKGSDLKRSGRKIQGFIFMELLLTIMRIIAVLASIASLAWCIPIYISETTKAEKSLSSLSVPLILDLLSIGTVILASLFCWFIQLVFGYRLPTNLGEIVCRLFRAEIEALHDELSISENKFETSQAQERTTWEYVAREFLHKYRFDAVFGPDRTGAILQSLQCGLEAIDQSESQADGSDSFI